MNIHNKYNNNRKSKWFVLISTCLGLLILNIDLFIVNVALPVISNNFHTSLSLASWTISAYALMLGVFPAGMGRIGDILGQKKLYITGLVIFTLSSLACGLAGNIAQLIFFRVIQGIGAAVLTPGTLSILVNAFPQKQRGLAIGLNGGIGGLGLVAGPVLGGLLIRGENWRWIFFINIPLGIVALLLTCLYVEEFYDENASRNIDWLGLACLCLGLFSILFAFTKAGNHGFDRYSILYLLAGAALLCLFVFAEGRIQNPLVELSLFRIPGFIMPCITLFLFSASLYGSQPYWSLFMQNYWGFTPLQGGLAFVPATTLVVLLTPFGGIISQKSGEGLRYITMTAILLVGVSFVYAAGIHGQSAYASRLLPALLIRSAGIPIVLSSTAFSVMNSVSSERAGIASGVLNMFKNTGTAMGVAILGQLYMHDVNNIVPKLAPEISLNKLAEIENLASKFIPAADEFLKPTTVAAILSGFRHMSVICALACFPALISAILIKSRLSDNPAEIKNVNE